MIRKLQQKIVAMTVVVLVALILLINGTMYIAGLHASRQLSRGLLQDIGERIADAGGIGSEKMLFPRELPKSQLFEGIDATICALALDENGKVVSSAALLGTELGIPQEVLSGILGDTGVESGYGEWGDYHYYQAVRTEGSYLVVASSGVGLHRILGRRLSRAFCLLMLPALAVVVLLCLVLSRFAVRPARDAVQKQQRFLSDAGHELKTPLSAITVNATVLAEEVGTNRYLDCIQEEANRMGVLLHRMMDVARMEIPQEREIQRHRIDLTALACQAVLPFESVAYEQNIRYVLDIQEGQTCQGDPDRLRQVVAILLDNAFKYVDVGGTVRVRLYQNGRHAVLEVSNTGRGISSEDLPHVFERFYRCDKARPDDGSYGLGLSIAQAIVEEHRGQITAESEPEGWTRFRVIL